MMTKKGKPKKSELPSTVSRSSKKAQRTFAKAHDSAAREYGEGERAMRTAWSALKHTYEKVGDRWKRKDKPGPSDAQAKGGTVVSVGSGSDYLAIDASTELLLRRTGQKPVQVSKSPDEQLRGTAGGPVLVAFDDTHRLRSMRVVG